MSCLTISFFCRNDSAIDKEDAFVTMQNSVNWQWQTTQGKQQLWQWKDGSTNWVALKDMVQVRD